MLFLAFQPSPVQPSPPLFLPEPYLCSHDKSTGTRIDCHISRHQTNILKLFIQFPILLVTQSLQESTITHGFHLHVRKNLRILRQKIIWDAKTECCALLGYRRSIGDRYHYHVRSTLGSFGTPKQETRGHWGRLLKISNEHFSILARILSTV